MLNRQKATLVHKRELTHQTCLFQFRIEGTDNFVFKPGQFITFDLPIHDKKTQRLKSYSIASHPDGTNLIELVIVKVPEGLGTGFLFDMQKLSIGTELDFRGPLGVFVLPEDLSTPHYLVCTGTGIAPFRSMIKHIKQHQIPFHAIHLIFGTRTLEDALFKEEMEDLANEMENFHYHLVLSREKWEGRTGYVHDVYKELSAGQSDAHFLLCGWRPMIDEARQQLSALGYDKHHVHFELYG